MIDAGDFGDGAAELDIFLENILQESSPPKTWPSSSSSSPTPSEPSSGTRKVGGIQADVEFSVICSGMTRASATEKRRRRVAKSRGSSSTSFSLHPRLESSLEFRPHPATFSTTHSSSD